MTYSTWLAEWLETYIKPTVKQKTHNRYQNIVTLHVLPKLGECELEEITALKLQRFITELLRSGNKKTGKGLSVNSVNLVIAVLQNSLETAYRLEITTHYTANKIRRPKQEEKDVTCFSLAEQKKIEEYVFRSGKPHLLGIVICLYTGLRLGELLALEWTDIDFQRKEISVTKTCSDGYEESGKFGRVVNAPKTHSSNRTVPIAHRLLPIIRELKKSSSGVYVISQNGIPPTVRAYQRNFESILKKLQIPHRGFHSLRHTFATRAIECGMDVKTLSEILGHKNAMVTLARYAHSMDEHKRNMVNALGKLL